MLENNLARTICHYCRLTGQLFWMQSNGEWSIHKRAPDANIEASLYDAINARRWWYRWHLSWPIECCCSQNCFCSYFVILLRFSFSCNSINAWKSTLFWVIWFHICFVFSIVFIFTLVNCFKMECCHLHRVIMTHWTFDFDYVGVLYILFHYLPESLCSCDW